MRWLDPAVADLERLLGVDSQIVRWALRKTLLLERDPDASRALLGDLTGVQAMQAWEAFITAR